MSLKESYMKAFSTPRPLAGAFQPKQRGLGGRTVKRVSRPLPTSQAPQAGQFIPPASQSQNLWTESRGYGAFRNTGAPARNPKVGYHWSQAKDNYLV